MIRGGRYLVSGRREYRGHGINTEFVAVLDPDAERRAINRGDITKLEHVTPSLQPGSFTFPTGWLNQQQEDNNG